ncbi:MAG TPA: hypothetical protein VK540_17340 [Polyangiaceae bacterium]|nr:hypothetical protein [Polyangiaceae bacterium]
MHDALASMFRLAVVTTWGGVAIAALGCSAPSDEPSVGRGGRAGSGTGGSSTGSGGATTAGSAGASGGSGTGATGGGAGSGATGGSSGTGATGGSAGSGATGGSSGTGGTSGSAGSGPTGGSSDGGGVPDASGPGKSDAAVGDTGPSRDGASSDAGVAGDGPSAERFSFFVTSLAAWRALSGNPNGFGGDLRFGKPTGLEGADEICRQIAERSMAGNGKTWRAFLSVAVGPSGGPVNAIDRIGPGPWYDRRGRLLAQTKAAVASGALRPMGADPAIVNDLPNEDGVPNHSPEGMPVDNHHFMTGSTAAGTLHTTGATATCQDWTTTVGTAGRPRCGFAWPRSVGSTQANGAHWVSGIDEAGCAAQILITGSGGAPPGSMGVGSGGGYGGIYCFALTP